MRFHVHNPIAHLWTEATLVLIVLSNVVDIEEFASSEVSLLFSHGL